MISLVAAAVIAAGAGAAPEPAKTPTYVPGSQAARATDDDIERALWGLLQTDPERVVCTEQILTGSRQPRAVCGSVKRWFDARPADEKAGERAPGPLVEEIKKQRSKAAAKAR